MATYLERISKSKEEKEQAAVAAAASRAKIQVSVDKLALTEAKAQAEAELEAAKDSIPFNPDRVVKAQRKVTAIIEDIAAVEAIEKELFG